MNMKQNSNVTRKGGMMTVIVVAVIVSLVALAGVLLFSNYRSQVDLRRSSFAYFYQKAKRESLQMGQFFKSLEVVVSRLSRSRELDAYHENLALGMSMEYGLRASLLSVETKFEQVIDDVVVEGVFNFEGIEFVRSDGVVLVKAGAAKMDYPFMMAAVKAFPEDGIRYVVDKDRTPPRIYMTVPYVFKGVFIGRIVALLSNRALGIAALREDDGAGGEVGLAYQGKYLPVLHEQEPDLSGLLMRVGNCDPAKFTDEYTVCKGLDTDKGDVVLFSVPVEGTPFYLFVVNPLKIIWSGWSPLNFLFIFIGLALTFAIFLFMLWRASIRNILLQVDLSDQARRTEDIEHRVQERTAELLMVNSRLSNEIEERKNAEKELEKTREDARKGEMWWRSLVQEVPAVTFVLQRDGMIKSVNRSFAGRSTDHLIGTSLFALLDLHEKGVLDDAFKDVFDKKISVTYQSRVVTPQGITLWYENHIGPIDSISDVTSAVCLSFDITERKVADDLLKEMSLAVEHSPVSVVITDHFGKVEYVNPRFTVSTGYRFQEIYGKVLKILRPGELSSVASAELWKILQSGSDWRGEYMERRKDGSEFWEFVTISPVVSQDGGMSHLIVLKEDITDRRRAQGQRDVDLKFLNELLDAIPSTVFFKNNAGIYQRCNKAFEEYVGKPRSEILGRSMTDFMCAKEAEVHRRSDEEVSRRGGRYVYEAKVPFSDGTLHDVMMFKSILKDRDGVSNGLIGVILDITEHKHLEEELHTNEVQLISALEEVKMFNIQLEQTQEKLLQQEKLAAIGFLAAGVAHEINNPLGFVNGNLTALGEYVDALLQMLKFCDALAGATDAGDLARAREIGSEFKEARENLEINYIVNDAEKLLKQTAVGTDRIKKIVEGLRSFSRTDSGEMVMVNMNDLLDGVFSIVWNEIKYKAEIIKEYGSVPMILCNPQQLGQVFVNLLVNAAQAIPEKGVITVKTFLQGNEVLVEVSDTGTGVSPEHMTKIFDPFFTTKEPGKGTGLGLSISYDIVKKHGGRIEVKSDVGKGTAFTVCLPEKKP